MSPSSSPLQTISRSLPARNNTMTQIFILSVIAGLLEGSYIAASSIGSGGTTSLVKYNIGRAILNGGQVLGGPFAGSVCNLMGIRKSLVIGGMWMILMVGSMWYYNVLHDPEFQYVASFMCGFMGCLFWTAWGSLLVGLPAEKDKGKAMALSWTMMQFGVILVSAILLIISNDRGEAAGFPNSIQLALIIVLACALGLTSLLLPFDKIVRKDGSPIIIPKKATVKEEIKGILTVIRDWRMTCLTPANFICLMFMVYHSAINTIQLTGRTRALASLIAGIGSTVGGIVTGWLTDHSGMRRRNRAMMALALVATTMWTTWIGGTINQTKFTRKHPGPLLDWTDSGSGPQLAFRFAIGMQDGALRTLIMWTLGSLSNDASTGARYTSLFLMTCGGGAVFGHNLDAVEIPLISEVSVILGIAVVCVPLMACVMWTIPDTTVEAENDHEVKASDESVETENASEKKSADEPTKDEPSSILELQKGYATPTPNHVV